MATQVVQCRLEESDLTALDRWVEEEKTNRAKLVSKIILAALANRNNAKNSVADAIAEMRQELVHIRCLVSSKSSDVDGGKDEVVEGQHVLELTRRVSFLPDQIAEAVAAHVGEEYASLVTRIGELLTNDLTSFRQALRGAVKCHLFIAAPNKSEREISAMVDKAFDS